mgnify:CR=1 FL=1
MANIALGLLIYALAVLVGSLVNRWAERDEMTTHGKMEGTA